MINDSLYEQALNIARTADVSTPPDSAVLYSVSFLPTKENKDRAFDYIRKVSGAMMIDQTPCGKQLVELGFDAGDLSEDDKLRVAEIWKVASKRFIESASGNVTAFVKNADPRSVFRSMELPEIMKNPNISSINGMPKSRFKSQTGW